MLDSGPPEHLTAGLVRGEGIAPLHEAFSVSFRQADPKGWKAWTEAAGTLDSALLCRVARHVSLFMARLFRVDEERKASIARHRAEAVVVRFKKEFVRRRVRRPRLLSPEAKAALEARIRTIAGHAEDLELAVARVAMDLQDREAASPENSRILAEIEAWAAASLSTSNWVSLRIPDKIDWPDGLVRVTRPDPADPGLLAGAGGARFHDDLGVRATADASAYCAGCQDRDRDACSRGRRGLNGDVATDPVGVPLDGCPLRVPVGETNHLVAEGDVLAGLAAVMSANPLCATTGHRVCWDCARSCNYARRQEPVDFPRVETAILAETLSLSWGFEIYDLLTRWNPLDSRRPTPRPPNGHNVLVVGLGPAGIALALHLLNEGFGCVAIDAAAIPAPAEHLVRGPIRDAKTIDGTFPSGFGGTAAFGITARWGSPSLPMLRLVLARRCRFRARGGVRFGDALTIEDAWRLGFDHVALATGAGRPLPPPFRNSGLAGVTQAVDFLRERHGGAVASIRDPVLVVGGGLTAVDAALTARGGGAGEVTICYRGRLQDSPAYRLNPIELARALEGGIRFREHLVPLEAIAGPDGGVRGLAFEEAHGDGRRRRELTAGTVLVAVGSMPDPPVPLEVEERGRWYRPFRIERGRLTPDPAGCFTSYQAGDRFVSFFGDAHPGQGGSVVRALAGAREGARVISELFVGRGQGSVAWDTLMARFEGRFA